MFKKPRALLLLSLFLLLVLAGAGLQLTREHNRIVTTAAQPAAQSRTPLVDQQSVDTARQLAKLATTPEEDELSRQALRVADHEVDLAFATALFRARAHPLPPDPKTKPIQDRIRSLTDRIKSDQNSIEQLKQQLGKARTSAAGDLQQQLDLAEAQLSLHQDELDDANQDLIRAGGNTEGQIQRMLEERQARQKATAAATSSAVKLSVFQLPGNLLGQFQVWRELRDKQAQLQQAQQQTAHAAADLSQKHDELERGLPPAQPDSTAAPAPSATAPGNAPNTLAVLRAQSDTRKHLAGYDKRIGDEQQLAQIYGDWSSLLAQRRQLALHALLRSAAWILLVLLAVVAADGAINHFHSRISADRWRLHTIRIVLRFAAEAVGLLVILIVVFGMPTQLSTVLALAGAGLTVALKDFIVAFFGWFVLMGRNGIRAGDWVEINGISGEVVEVGLLHTVLLETGNWTDSGHPTGRKVTFVNSFAIEGHYFNFSTTGQWLWDVLEVLLTPDQDLYSAIDSIQKIVTAETEANAKLAQQEWQRAAPNSRGQALSAGPAISVRPTNLGINVVVGYITPAHTRHEVRARLYQAIVELLHGKNPASLTGEEGSRNVKLAPGQ
jgi:small-conductance mechanosensitive channel